MSDSNGVRTFDERMAQMLKEAHESGELRSAKSWGKPLELDGYFETPPELRMAFKVLKDAGCTPPEVELLKRLAALRAELGRVDAASEEGARLREQINQLEVEVCVRLERLARPRP